MCGRYELNETPARLGSRYRVQPGDIEFADEYWRKGDEMIASYTILTTQPNAIMEPIHDRMPVIIADDEGDAWPRSRHVAGSVRALCMPCPSEWLAMEHLPS